MVYRLAKRWIEPRDKYDLLNLPEYWREAIEKPDVRIHVTYEDGTQRFAIYDTGTQTISSNDSCPIMAHHTLYKTCWCCGQRG